MKIGLELATALLIVIMFSFSALAWLEYEERAKSNSAVFRGVMVRYIALAEVLGLLGIAGPTLTGKFTGVIPIAALGIAVGFGYVCFTHARWNHLGRAIVFGILTAMALLLAWGRFGAYAL